MMRLLLDTCVIIDWLTDTDPFDDHVWDILNDPGTKLYVSAETARELIVSFNNKKLLPKYWKTAEEMLLAMKDEAMVDILPITERTMFTYSRLTLNEAEDHRDHRAAHAPVERPEVCLLPQSGTRPLGILNPQRHNH